MVGVSTKHIFPSWCDCSQRFWLIFFFCLLTLVLTLCNELYFLCGVQEKLESQKKNFSFFRQTYFLLVPWWNQEVKIHADLFREWDVYHKIIFLWYVCLLSLYCWSLHSISGKVKASDECALNTALSNGS